MRILYFHQHYSTPKGTGGIRSYAMARALIARGHQVTMVCGSFVGGQTGLEGAYVNGVRRGQIEGINVIEFELPYSNKLSFLKRVLVFLSFAWRSIKVAMTEDYDLIFATTTPLTVGIPGIFARWLRRKPFVFEVRDLWPELPKAMGVITNPVVLFLMAVLERLSYLSAHRLVALSPGISRGIQRVGVPSTRVEMIPNGCDVDIFDAPAEPWRPAGISDTDLMAVFAGSHGLANGLSSVLAGAAELKRRGRTDIKILLIGDGQQKAGLKQSAAEQGLDNVIFHDPVNKMRLSGLMKSTDVGLQILANVEAFYYGTSPNKFFDYIAAGVPVLNNYPGWLADLIRENKCGFAVAADDPLAFADALEQAAADRQALKQMGLAARQLAEQQFRRDLLAQRFVETLESAA